MVSITQISSGTDLLSSTGTKATATAAATSTEASKATTNAAKLKNQFLSILLTQMQHQNPLDPMDTKEFTAQLTQFSSLEQQIDTNTKLDGLVSNLKQSAVASSFGYIGQYVDIASNQTALQDDKANWTYALPASTEAAVIKVTDSKGTVLYTQTVENASGRGEIAAGTYKLDLTKADLPSTTADGTPLKLTITAKGADGKDLNVTTRTTVRVDSIQSDTSGTYLMAGNVLYSLSDVKKIVKAPTTPTV